MRRGLKKGIVDSLIILSLGICVSLFDYFNKGHLSSWIQSLFGTINYWDLSLKIITVDSTITSFSLVFVGYVMSSNKALIKCDNIDVYEVKEIYYKVISDSFIKFFPKVFNKTMFTRIIIIISTTLLEIVFMIFNLKMTVVFLFFITVYELFEILYTSQKVIFYKKNELGTIISEMLAEYWESFKVKRPISEVLTIADLLTMTHEYLGRNKKDAEIVKDTYVHSLKLAMYSKEEDVWDLVFTILKDYSFEYIYELLYLSVLDLSSIDITYLRKMFSIFDLNIRKDNDFDNLRDNFAKIYFFLDDLLEFFKRNDRNFISEIHSCINYILEVYDDELTQDSKTILNYLLIE